MPVANEIIFPIAWFGLIEKRDGDRSSSVSKYQSFFEVWKGSCLFPFVQGGREKIDERKRGVSGAAGDKSRAGLRTHARSARGIYFFL